MCFYIKKSEETLTSQDNWKWTTDGAVQGKEWFSGTEVLSSGSRRAFRNIYFMNKDEYPSICNRKKWNIIIQGSSRLICYDKCIINKYLELGSDVESLWNTDHWDCFYVYMYFKGRVVWVPPLHIKGYYSKRIQSRDHFWHGWSQSSGNTGSNIS